MVFRTADGLRPRGIDVLRNSCCSHVGRFKCHGTENDRIEYLHTRVLQYVARGDRTMFGKLSNIVNVIK